MKRRTGFVLLLTVGACVLACTWSSAPSTPPAPSPTSSLRPPSSQTPPLFTATPSPAPGTTPTATAPDPDVASVRYAERPAWRAFLSWPDDCEETYGRLAHQPQDDGGISIYPVAEEQYLAFVTCNVGPYWEDLRAYWLDYRTSPPAAWPISVPELAQDDAPEQGLHEVDVLHGSFPTYHPDTQTLTNLVAYRGLRDCGVFYQYHLAGTHFVLDEARYRECDAESDVDALDTSRWTLIYPLPLSAGLFRQVASLPPDMPGQITRLEALANGDLRLVTTAGVAVLHDGVWQPYFLAPEQHFIGADNAGRLWYFPEQTPTSIYYWDSTIADQGGSAFVRADAGWLPVDDPAALESRGVLTDDQGQVWLATPQDVRVFASGRWTIFTQETLEMLPNPDADKEFVLAFVPGQQQMWVGECDWGGPGPVGGGGARWLDTAAFAAGTVAWRGAQSPLGGGCVTAIAADAAGYVWIGMDRGIVQLFDQTSGHWSRSTLPGSGDHRQGYPLSLMLDPSGAPWVLSALCGGASCDVARAFYRFQDGTWSQVFGPEDASEDFPATDSSLLILFDGAGTPWVFAGWSVFRIEDNRLQQPAVAEMSVIAGAVDANGQLWVIGQTAESDPALWVLQSMGNPR